MCSEFNTIGPLSWNAHIRGDLIQTHPLPARVTRVARVDPAEYDVDSSIIAAQLRSHS